MVTKAQTKKVFTHHPALVKGAKQLVVQEAFDTWRVGQSTQTAWGGGLGWNPGEKGIFFVDADFS